MPTIMQLTHNNVRERFSACVTASSAKAYLDTIVDVWRALDATRLLRPHRMILTLKGDVLHVVYNTTLGHEYTFDIPPFADIKESFERSNRTTQTFFNAATNPKQ
jgi:hypothetical protein